MWFYRNFVIRLILIVIISGYTSGCAIQAQFLLDLLPKKLTTEPVKIENSTILMSATLRNYEKPSQQPVPFALILERVADQKVVSLWLNEKDINKTITLMRADRYLIRVELEPGRYILRGINSASDSYLNSGSFFTPIGAYLTASKNTLLYLGHITANLRATQNMSETSAGTYALLEARIKAGTFDTSISDQWAADASKFRKIWPSLEEEQVKKAVLTPTMNVIK